MLEGISMNRRIAMILLICSLIFSNAVVAESDSTSSTEENDSIILFIDLIDGMITASDVEVSGFLENENIPSDIWWELSDSDDLISTGTMMSSLHEAQGDFDRNRWEFQFTIIASSAMPCSCNVIVYAIEENSPPITEARSIFFDDGSSTLPPTLYIDNSIYEQWTSDSLTLLGSSIMIDSNIPTLRYSIAPSSDIRCQTNSDPPYSSSIEIDEGVLEWPSNGEFAFDIDVSEHIDGWYDLTVFSVEHSSFEFSHICIPIRIDNSAPIPTISGPETVMEGVGTILLDGSTTTDHHWGINGLTYIWSVKDQTQHGSIPAMISANKSNRELQIDISNSGTFDVTLTVVDLAGNQASISKTITVTNLHPIARMHVDGIAVNDGDILVMDEHDFLSLDASHSSDTDNDIGSLRYIWRVNNVPIFEGTNRELFWPEEQSRSFSLSLEVVDNDASSSIVTILVRNSDVGITISSPIVILLGSAIFLSYAIFKRSQSRESDSDIPKWV
jgi:hypothetical protein